MFHPLPGRPSHCPLCALALLRVLALVASLTVGGALAQTPVIEVTGNGRVISDGDNTPSLLDHTDFGAARVAEEVVDRVFTIENVGGGTMRIFGIQRIGGSPGNFTIPIPPAQFLTPGATTQFLVRFIPSLPGGIRNTNLVINTNDQTTPQFAFLIQGDALVPSPEINIQGNGIDIADGDPLPHPGDHTDFGEIDVSAGAITRTFTLQNIGEAPLEITGFEFTGGNSSDFTFTSFPASRVPHGSQFEFEISFDPSFTGLHNTNVRIHNSDADESVYDFVIQGLGTTAAGEVSLFGNGVLIEAGDDSPSAHDHTKFVSTKVGTSVRRTFTIRNTGNDTLTIASIVLTGGDAGDFSVPELPTAPLAPNEFATFEVRFQPSAFGLRNTTLQIRSNDPITPTYDVQLQGAGGAFELVKVERDGNDALITFTTNPDTNVSNYFYTVLHSTADLEDWSPITALPSPGATVEQIRHLDGFRGPTGYWQIREVVVP